MRQLLLFLLLTLIISPLSTSDAVALAPCETRTTVLEVPQVDVTRFCLERVVDDASAGEMAFTALAVAPDGTLYAARPQTGEIFAITDTDEDGLPDTPKQIVAGLTTPNALIFNEDTLYIAGGSHLYRWRESHGIDTLVDDLPAGTGFWTGGLALDPDAQRLYVGIGASCDVCTGEDGRGRILSFALDGSDQRVAASGVRQPAGMVWWQDALWFSDTGRDALERGNSDELNRMPLDQSGGDYGFPACPGADRQPDPAFPDAGCSQVILPDFTFPANSSPVSLAAYISDTFPDLKGGLLVALSGSYNDSRLRGYETGVVYPASNGQPARYETLIPLLENFNQQYQKLGFFPHHPYSVAVSPEGWIYISTGGGKIYALRPL